MNYQLLPKSVCLIRSHKGDLAVKLAGCGLLFVVLALLNNNFSKYTKHPILLNIPQTIIFACIFFIYPAYYCAWLFFAQKGKVYRSVARSLRTIGTYDSTINWSLLPYFKVTTKTVMISMKDMRLRHILELYDCMFSTLLPDGYIEVEHYLSEDEAWLLIDYIEAGEKNRLVFKSPSDVMKWVVNDEKLPLDCTSSIDLRMTPHLLITGASGSGKSYYASFITALSLLKDYDVYVCDPKHSYSLFKQQPRCQLAFSPDEIYDLLKTVLKVVQTRMEEMEKILATDMTAVASDYGYHPILIVMEEYMALMNSGFDKKKLKEIDDMVLQISAMGRALSVHLIIVMQVSSAKDLNSSIRANCGKLVFGNATQTIYETAFNMKSIPKVNVKMRPGEGIGSFEVGTFRFMAPTLYFPLYRLLPDQSKYKRRKEVTG